MDSKRRLLFSLVPVAALILLGECGARVVGAPACEPIQPAAEGWETMVADPRYLWRLEPDRLFESPGGDTMTNSAGFRTELLPGDPKPEGQVRVVLTGDSSVFGWGQHDGHTYAEQLQQMLRASFPERDVRVVNLGVPGYSTVQTRRMLEDVGWSYEPDLLVVHNIFSDCNIDAFQDEAALALTDPEPRLLHHSRLYCSVYMPWARYQAGLNQETNRVLMPGIPTGANQARRLEEIDAVIDLSRVPLADYLDNLEALQEGVEQRGGRMVLAPLAQEWDVGRWTAPMAQPTEGQALPWYPYREAQAEWAAARGVPRLDLPSLFLASGISGDELFIDNMHPSVTGAWVMARALTELVREQPELLGLRAADLSPRFDPGTPPRQKRDLQRGPAQPTGKPPGPPGPPPSNQR